MNKLPKIGKPTEREIALIVYLGKCIDSWIEEHETERRELICALFKICHTVFGKQTPFELKEQIKEVNEFCYYLKEKLKGTLLHELD